MRPNADPIQAPKQDKKEEDKNLTYLPLIFIF
jgi:hypothetical protein